MIRIRPRWFLLFALASISLLQADEAFPEKSPVPMPQPAVEQTAEKVRPSLLTVINSNREGYAQGIGTGFVISKDGLVATNLHVVGEARPISVELQDGRRPKVTEVLAWSRRHDLIIFRLDVNDLPALELGPFEKMRQGTAVVAMGNPLGLRYSVVSGIVSEVRPIDGEEMIQLAMPIERGNSGGPLVDAEGRVRGIVNMKSAVTDNLGYAIPVTALRDLLTHPAPVRIENWLTIGALNPKLWRATDSLWTQRAGRILVHGRGEGFGGRALCLYQPEPPPVPFEVSVRVRLDEEGGAAGLAFCADGGDLHYGFYPSNGKLRLTRFDGPDVYHWTVLEEFTSPHYKPEDWNHLRVRVETERLVCYLNGQEVLVHRDSKLRSGRVGLCKFRQSEPEFKDFRVGSRLYLDADETELAVLREKVQRATSGQPSALEIAAEMTKNPSATRDLIDGELKALESRASDLRKLSSRVVEASIQQALLKVLDHPEEVNVNLAEAALIVAKLDNPDVDVPHYLAEIDRIADDFRAILTDKENAEAELRLDRLVRWMFEESGFHGSQDDYASKSNSYLNEVIDDREGLPITLAILFLEVGHRVDLPLAGISLPGHFVVQYRGGENPDDGPYLDVFSKGLRFSRQTAMEKLGALLPRQPNDDDFQPAPKRQIILRVLRNLIGLQLDAKSEAALPYLNLAIAISPESASERLSRAIVLYQSGRRQEAKSDIGWLLEKQPDGIDLGRLQEWFDAISAGR